MLIFRGHKLDKKISRGFRKGVAANALNSWFCHNPLGGNRLGVQCSPEMSRGLSSKDDVGGSEQRVHH
jgi:hypothetical protein